MARAESPAGAPPAAPSAAARTLTPEEADALQRDGFCVVDDFLPADLAAGLLAEARRAAPEMAPHQWVFGGAKLPKPGIHELDMHHPRAESAMPMFHRFFMEDVPGVVDQVARAASGPLWPHPLGRAATGPPAAVSLKVQRNEGLGACFPLHHDNPGPPSKRALTVVVYLNPEWEPGDGGEIEFVPFGAAPVRVAPLFNRAVVFRSDLVLHGVEPAHAERFCFTVWADSPGVNGPSECNLTSSHVGAGAHHDGTPDGLVRFFRSSPLQRCLARSVYRREMSDGLRKCLTAAGGVGERAVDTVLKAHNAAADSQLGHPLLGPMLAAIDEAMGRAPATDG